MSHVQVAKYVKKPDVYYLIVGVPILKKNMSMIHQSEKKSFAEDKLITRLFLTPLSPIFLILTKVIDIKWAKCIKL